MVALKASQVARYLKAPDPQHRGFLVYGTDAGLVAERAALLAETLCAQGGAGGEVVRLDERDLAENPDRLMVEARMSSLFATHKVLRVSASAQVTAEQVTELLADPETVPFVLEAGNLKPSAKLRRLFEKAPTGVTLPCFPDSSRDLHGLMDEVFGEFGCRVAPAARQTLVSLLGADRALSRSELTKLALYAGPGEEITEAHIQAIMGDTSQLATARILDAALLGDANEALAQLDRYLASGQGASGLLVLLTRHVMDLHLARTQVAAGKSLDQALGSFRPPLHFSRKDKVKAQLRRWSEADLVRALQALRETTRMTRRQPELERTAIEALFLAFQRPGTMLPLRP